MAVEKTSTAFFFLRELALHVVSKGGVLIWGMESGFGFTY